MLSPNTHPERAREAAGAAGHRIVADIAAECAGKYYPVISTKAGGAEKLSRSELLFGRFFAEDEDFPVRASRELSELEDTLKQNPSASGLAERKALLEEALKECAK